MQRRALLAFNTGFTSDEIVLSHPFAKLASQFPSFRAIASRRVALNCFSWSDKSPTSIDAVFPRGVLNRTVDGSSPRLSNAARQ
jgi:hypothetical protein